MATPDLQAVTFVSPAFERLTGLNCEEFVSDWRIWAQSIHEDDRQAVAAAHAQLAQGRPYDIAKTDGRNLFRFLASQVCDEAQGWLFSRPQPGLEITALLAARQAERYDRVPRALL